MGTYGRRWRWRRSRATWWPYSKYYVDRDMQPWFTVYFFDIGHPCYDQLTPVKTRYLLTSIMWQYRGFKFTAHQGHVSFWSWPLTKCWFSIGSQAHVRLTCWRQGTIVWKTVNASPGLKLIRMITFSFIQMFFAALFWAYDDYKTQDRKSNSKQKTSPQSFKTQINILPFPGLAQSGTEQPGQGAPKSIY